MATVLQGVDGTNYHSLILAANPNSYFDSAEYCVYDTCSIHIVGLITVGLGVAELNSFSADSYSQEDEVRYLGIFSSGLWYFIDKRCITTIFQ